MGRAGEGREASPSPACPRTESFENPGHGRASRACAPFLAFTAEAGYGEAPSPGRHMLPRGVWGQGLGALGRGAVRAASSPRLPLRKRATEKPLPGRHVLPRGRLRTRVGGARGITGRHVLPGSVKGQGLGAQWKKSGGQPPERHTLLKVLKVIKRGRRPQDPHPPDGAYERECYSSTGTHSSWLQIQAWGCSTEKKTRVGSSGPS